MSALIRHILFDFDGTIVNSLELSLQIVNDMADKYHYRRATLEEIQRLKSLPLAERLRQIGLPLYKIPALKAESAVLYKRGLASLKPAEGMKELLHTLKREEHHMSVLSSNTEDNIAAFLKNNGLELFDFIRSSNLFGKDKAIGKFMKQLGLRADELLYVGDELRDIEACKKAGVRIVAVAWGFDPLPLLESGNPDGIAKSPEELLRFIRRMQTGGRA